MTAMTAMTAPRPGRLALRRWYGAAACRCTPARQSATGLVLLVVLAVPALRQLLEASMSRHMLLQFPLFMLAGALLAGGLRTGGRRAVARWNGHGISGLVATGLVLSLLMVPRALDLALLSPAIELAKCAALVLTGAALRLSWRPAGLVVQGFFLGNLLPMMAVVGQLYIDSPVRVCNAYLLGDQVQLGQWLVRLAAALAVGWLVLVACALVRKESAAEAALPAPSAPPHGG